MSTQLDTEPPSPTSDRALALYRLMSKVQHGDRRVRKALSSGEAAMSYWPVDGQEAMSAGAMLALADDDQLVTTYRGLGDVLAKGIDLRGYFAEILGRRDGLSRGKAGAMGFTIPTTASPGRPALSGRARSSRTASRWQRHDDAQARSCWSASGTARPASGTCMRP